jgi:DNA-binding response OmpR family regulator
MNRLLVLDDSPKDTKDAIDAAASVGCCKVETCITLRSAVVYLEHGLQGDTPLPDAIVVDLDLGQDSGFELLRIWRSSTQLRSIPLIVWTDLDYTAGCELYEVTAIVHKWKGLAKLREALANL